jgi:hypothetical protein
MAKMVFETATGDQFWLELNNGQIQLWWDCKSLGMGPIIVVTGEDDLDEFTKFVDWQCCDLLRK